MLAYVDSARLKDKYESGGSRACFKNTKTYFVVGSQ